MWQTTLNEVQTTEYKTKATINLSLALNKDNQQKEAKALLLSALKETNNANLLSTIYEALSKVELSLGNQEIAIYCKDKSLEFDPSNRNGLFDSAYSAGDNDVDDVSISNYTTLLNIDSEHSTARNNLGVRAEAANLKTIAIDNYKTSSDANNTLAMANQGYLLMEAGFLMEAEALAQKALELPDPHQNVFSLMTAIHQRREKESEAWEKLKRKALTRQEFKRSYIEQYYLGDSQLLKGEWILADKNKVEIELDGDLLTSQWIEKQEGLQARVYQMEITGKVSGSTFSGTYSRRRIEGPPPGLLGISGDKNITCIGTLSDDSNTLRIVATKLEDDFTLSATRKES